MEEAGHAWPASLMEGGGRTPGERDATFLRGTGDVRLGVGVKLEEPGEAVGVENLARDRVPRRGSIRQHRGCAAAGEAPVASLPL